MEEFCRCEACMKKFRSMICPHCLHFHMETGGSVCSSCGVRICTKCVTFRAWRRTEKGPLPLFNCFPCQKIAIDNGAKVEVFKIGAYGE